MEDRCNNTTKKRRYNPKCINCNQFGHKPSKCEKPRKPIICYMCGESGHTGPWCPNTICLRVSFLYGKIIYYLSNESLSFLQCGNKTQAFMRGCSFCMHKNNITCSVCKERGHSSDYCPNKWRKYHSTVSAILKRIIFAYVYNVQYKIISFIFRLHSILILKRLLIIIHVNIVAIAAFGAISQMIVAR